VLAGELLLAAASICLDDQRRQLLSISISPCPSMAADGGDTQLMMRLLTERLAGVLGDRSGSSARDDSERPTSLRKVEIQIAGSELVAELWRGCAELPHRPRLGWHPHPHRTHRRADWIRTLLEALREEADHSADHPPGTRIHRYRRELMSQQPNELPADLPKDAAHRLEELEHGLFTSDLSVNEFLLVKDAGFHPLGFVMGSSIYHIGLQTRKWSTSQELDKLTSAMYSARELAINRMEEEAIELGADGVVGVRLDVNYYEFGADSAEFIAMGTAIKAEDGKSYRNSKASPSPRTSPARRSGRSGRSATSHSASSWAPACTTSPIAESARRCRRWARTPSCRTTPRRSMTPASSR
jgi:uncharacterized protein YbjQ (UPF0145 family)